MLGITRLVPMVCLLISRSKFFLSPQQQVQDSELTFLFHLHGELLYWGAVHWGSRAFFHIIFPDDSAGMVVIRYFLQSLGFLNLKWFSSIQIFTSSMFYFTLRLHISAETHLLIIFLSVLSIFGNALILGSGFHTFSLSQKWLAFPNKSVHSLW